MMRRSKRRGKSSSMIFMRACASVQALYFLGGFMFRKLTKKVVDGAKEVVKEETQKTTDEVRTDILNVVKAITPIILGIVAIVAVTAIIRRPSPTVVKIVLKSV